jgi:hypothetical protein
MDDMKPNGVLIRVESRLQFFPIDDGGELIGTYSLCVGDTDDDLSRTKIHESYIMFVYAYFELPDGKPYVDFTDWDAKADLIATVEYKFISKWLGGFELFREEPEVEPKTAKTIIELMREGEGSFQECVKYLHGILMASDPLGEPA